MTGRSHRQAVETSPSDGQEHLARSADRTSGIQAAHRLAKDCLIILGVTDGQVATEGLATIGVPGGDRGRFRSISWSKTDRELGCWYVAAVRAAEVGQMKPGKSLTLHSAGLQAPMVIKLPPVLNEAGPFAAELRGCAGGNLPDAVRFLLDTFSSKASRQMETVSAFLVALLDGVSQEAGMVETLGVIDGEGFLIQGWMCRPLVGRQRLLVLGNVLDEHEATCASFYRNDLDGRGVGMLALLHVRGGTPVEMLRRLYLRAGDQFYRLTVLPNAMRLRDDQVPNHLRTILPSLHVDEGLQRTLRAAARPRFSGVETVSSLDQPIRMAVDLVVRIPGAGWYIAGWLLDPASLVSAVMLRGRDGMAERLDLHWTRVPRQDVSANFRSDPLFQGRIDHDLHGFTVFVPQPAVQADVWLELRLDEDFSAFMPARSVSGEGWEGRRRLLESVDVHKTSAREVIERHLGPLFHAAKSSPKRNIEHRVLRARAASLPMPEAVLIIPIVEADLRTKLIVSELASRNPGKGIAPVFVCSPVIGDGTSVLLRELAFYGSDAEVLQADQPITSCEALEIGVRATKAAKLVFMSPSTHPLQDNWATHLLAFQDTGDEPAVVSPTLLYEDWSVCYAGIDGMRFLDAAPFANAACSRAGYPRNSMPKSGIMSTLAASLDCCAMTRSTFELVDGLSAGYALAEPNGLDFFLRLRKAGARIFWMPEVEAYTLGDWGAQNAYWMWTGELVDGWSLRASWKDRLPAAIDLVPPVKVVETNQAALTEAILSGRRMDGGLHTGDGFGATTLGIT